MDCICLARKWIWAQRDEPKNIERGGETDSKTLLFRKFRFTKIKLSQKHEVEGKRRVFLKRLSSDIRFFLHP